LKNYTFTYEQINNMKHCIGFHNSKVTGTKHRKMEAHRNYYVTSDNDTMLDNLVDQGLMIKRKIGECEGDNSKVYIVSEEGFIFLSELTGIIITEMR